MGGAAPMKAMKGAASMKPMTKTGLAEALAAESGLKKSECVKVITSLGGIAAKELKSAAKFTIPGVCMVKTRKKAATPAGKREIFGKVVVVKAKPAKTVVKSFAVAALKKAF